MNLLNLFKKEQAITTEEAIKQYREILARYDNPKADDIDMLNTLATILHISPADVEKDIQTATKIHEMEAFIQKYEADKPKREALIVRLEKNRADKKAAVETYDTDFQKLQKEHADINPCYQVGSMRAELNILKEKNHRLFGDFNAPQPPEPKTITIPVKGHRELPPEPKPTEMVLATINGNQQLLPKAIAIGQNLPWQAVPSDTELV